MQREGEVMGRGVGRKEQRGGMQREGEGNGEGRGGGRGEYMGRGREEVACKRRKTERALAVSQPHCHEARVQQTHVTNDSTYCLPVHFARPGYRFPHSCSVGWPS